MKLNKEQVLQILPHRDPFLFIDTIESINVPDNPKGDGEFTVRELAGARVVAHFHTRADHPIFKGHFPDYPIFPGVCQIEMMAQATTFIVFLLEKNPFAKKLDVALLGVDSARFRKPIFPGMDLKIVTNTLKVRGPMLTSECKIFHEDQLMSEVSILASLKME